MSCGNLILQDQFGAFYIVSAGDDGSVIASQVPMSIPGFVPPVLMSPSFYWQLSVNFDPLSTSIQADPVGATTASPSFLLSSATARAFALTIDDNGILAITSQSGTVS